jgi:hypothetical protein
VTDLDDQIVMAKLAYAAYGQTTDFKNYQGNPMPNWEDLGDTIQAAWMSAANAVAGYLEGPPAADELHDRIAVPDETDS